MPDTARDLGPRLHIQLASLYSLQAHTAKRFIEDG